MTKIVVFDSGLGSLSVITPIRKRIKADIIYFADQKNYPYGTKTISQLDKIIKSTIIQLQEKFEPDIIVVGSNTPSLLLDIEKKDKIIGVFPPLKEAVQSTKSGKIGILATKSVVENKILDKYIRKNVPSRIHVEKINTPYIENNVDVFTLSSTHLPFLVLILKELFPGITFLDPADALTQYISNISKHKSKKSSLKIYSSGNTESFHKQLLKIGIKNKVNPL